MWLSSNKDNYEDISRMHPCGGINVCFATGSRSRITMQCRTHQLSTTAPQLNTVQAQHTTVLAVLKNYLFYHSRCPWILVGCSWSCVSHRSKKVEDHMMCCSLTS